MQLALDLLGALAGQRFGRGQARLQLGEALALLTEGLQLLREPRLAQLDLLLGRGDLRRAQVELRGARREVATECEPVVTLGEGRGQLNAEVAFAVQ